MKQIRLFSLILVLCLFMAGTTAHAQAVGDYGSAASGNWGTPGTWVVCVTDGTWEGATIATSVTTSSSTTVSFYIRSGHTVVVEASPKYCKNLFVESGAKLWANSANTSPRYLRFSATGGNVTNNGEIGGATDALSFYMYGTNLTLSGNGTYSIGRIQPQVDNTSTLIDANVTITYAGSAGGGSTGLYPNGKENYSVTINEGKNLTMANNSYIAVNGSSGISAGTTNMNLIVNGTLTASGANSTINLNTAAGKTVNVNVGPAGIINAYGSVRAYYTNMGTVNINVANGGAINSYSTSGLALSKAEITLNGTINCSGSANDSIGISTIGTNGALFLSKSTGEGILTGAMTLNGTVFLNTGSKLKLGNNNLAVSSTGGILNAGSTNYIITNGTGTLTMPAPAGVATLFPVGASATSYDPVTVKPATASNFSVKVGTTLSGSAVNCTLNEKEWDITPVTPSETELTLTPSAITATGLDPIIGHFESGAYKYKKATQNGNSYTATFSSFSPFVTGASDVISATEKISNALFVSMIGGKAYLNGTTEGQLISVYGTNGQLIKNIEATGNHTALQLNKGIYVVKVSNETMKVVL